MYRSGFVYSYSHVNRVTFGWVVADVGRELSTEVGGRDRDLNCEQCDRGMSIDMMPRSHVGSHPSQNYVALIDPLRT